MYKYVRREGGPEQAMSVRILNQAHVTALLPMRECIEVMDAALRTLAAGGAILPLRPALRLRWQGIFGVMPAYLGRRLPARDRRLP
jgi:ornithine cyclodeaminase/alanine dehydrogenase-like protein (mu-crystallin family)